MKELKEKVLKESKKAAENAAETLLLVINARLREEKLKVSDERADEIGEVSAKIISIWGSKAAIFTFVSEFISKAIDKSLDEIGANNEKATPHNINTFSRDIQDIEDKAVEHVMKTFPLHGALKVEDVPIKELQDLILTAVRGAITIAVNTSSLAVATYLENKTSGPKPDPQDCSEKTRVSNEMALLLASSDCDGLKQTLVFTNIVKKYINSCLDKLVDSNHRITAEIIGTVTDEIQDSEDKAIGVIMQCSVGYLTL